MTCRAHRDRGFQEHCGDCGFQQAKREGAFMSMAKAESIALPRATFDYGSAVDRPKSNPDWVEQRIREWLVALEPVQGHIPLKTAIPEFTMSLNLMRSVLSRMEHAREYGTHHD